MADDKRPRSVLACLGWLVAACVVALVAGWLAASQWASSAGRRAEAAWARTIPLSVLRERNAPQSANSEALLLEEDAARVGIDLAPRGSGRVHEIAPLAGGVLDGLHDHLQAVLESGGALDGPLVAALRERGAALDALAVDAAAGAPPRWETTVSLRLARNPVPTERAALLMAEAARLQSDGGRGAPADGERDEHLTRPGVPRRTALVLLHELLVVRALDLTATGDVPGAQRALRGAERLEDGLMASPDLTGLALATDLARLRLAALRRLPLTSPPETLAHARQSALVHGAILGEAAGWLDEEARPRPGGPLASVMRRLLGPAQRVTASGALEELAALAEAARAQPCRPAPPSGERRPWWDPLGSRYVADAAKAWRDALDADHEAELVRRMFRWRELGLQLGETGGVSPSCLQAAAEPSPSCADWTFECKVLADGRARIVRKGASAGEPKGTSEGITIDGAR